MNRDPLIFLDDIHDSIDAIKKYVKGMQKSEFMKADVIQDAVIRRLEIIGEAANRLPDSIKSKHPNVPWDQIIGMRNFLIHDYGRVNLELVWDTIQLDLPDLSAKLKTI